MSCGCKSPQSVQSWYDFDDMTPQDPLDLIAFAVLDSDVGVPANSVLYSAPLSGSVWIPSPFTITSGPLISTNAGDSGMMVQDAVDFNFSHKTANTATTIAPPINKIVFMRAGVQWRNTMLLNLGSSPTYSQLELSFLDNAATRGDAQGTIPVIRWSGGGPYSGPKTLTLILKQPGRFTLGLCAVNTLSTPDWSMFELDIIAV